MDATLAPKCRNCGVEGITYARYCHMCGDRLTLLTGAPVVERRIVSVLFADLEGFTAFSAERDPEEVREMLTKYIDAARGTVSRYGGVIEKFIGDAVMAVWGTPVAHEDDCQRAVRAALELVAAVSAIEVEPGVFLRIRAGVVSGEVAVTLGSTGQGMVAGDVVNTASRLQSHAPAGCVYVDDVTHDATEVAIVYSDGGMLELKGKPAPVHVWQAERVAPLARGLEAPFHGRDTEFQTLKSMYQRVVGDGKARLVSVTGAAGLGKSRLISEFQRDLEEFSSPPHIGLGYCEEMQSGSLGALVGIVQSLLRVSGEDADELIAERVHEVLRRHMRSDDEVVWTRKRVMQLLRPDKDTSFDPLELHNAWGGLLRSFAGDEPLVLIIEDAHWAEPELLDFLRYLVAETSSVMLVVASRGQIDKLEAGERSGDHIAIDLRPVSSDSIGNMISLLVPELEAKVRDEIVARSDGVPLYAVETLRMLANRGVLTRDATSYRVRGELTDIEMPTTIQSLIGGRLDLLPRDDIAVVQAASVIGARFSPALLGKLEHLSPERLVDALRVLVHEEVFGCDASNGAEGTVYFFTQGQIRQSAYLRLAKRDRLRKHIEIAQILEGDTIGPQQDVIAAHYLQAYDMDPTNEAALIGARRTVVVAAARAAAVGAIESAHMYYVRAITLVETDAERVRLALRAGDLMSRVANWAAYQGHANEAHEFARRCGDGELLALSLSELANCASGSGQGTLALQLMRQAHDALPPDASPSLEELVVRRREDYEGISGDLETAYRLSERSCELAASLNDPLVLGQALYSRAWPLGFMGRTYESYALFWAARNLVRQNENLSAQLEWEVLYREATVRAEFGFFDELVPLTDEIAAIADRRGDTIADVLQTMLRVKSLFYQGDWDRALDLGVQISDRVPGVSEPSMSPYRYMALIHAERGDAEGARKYLEAVPTDSDPGDTDCTLGPLAHSGVAYALGDYEAALKGTIDILAARVNTGGPRMAEEAFAIVRGAGRELGRWDLLEQAISLGESARPTRRTIPLQGHLALTRAQLLVHSGRDADALTEFEGAVRAFRQAQQKYALATALAAFSEWTSDDLRSGEVRLEAISLFRELGAVMSLRRLGQGLEPTGAALPNPTATPSRL